MSKRRRKPRVIHVHGKRWFERTNGNTYHSVSVWVDGEHVHKTDFAYGYGNQYVWTARKWLAANGYLPDIEERLGRPGQALWSYCQDHGIRLVDEVTDVARKRDL